MAKQAVVRSSAELYEYANHLKWAAGDLHECYQNVKAHATDFSSRWKDDSAETFMLLLEKEEHVIRELETEFARYESAVRKRADLVREYHARGKMYRI